MVLANWGSQAEEFTEERVALKKKRKKTGIILTKFGKAYGELA